MGAFGRLAGSASRAAGMVLDAVDKELDAGTSDASKYQRKLAAASQRRIELAVEERRRSQKTDLSFIEKANQRALERLLAQTSIEIGNRDKTETQTFEIDGRVVEVDDVDPWVRPSTRSRVDALPVRTPRSRPLVPPTLPSARVSPHTPDPDPRRNPRTIATGARSAARTLAIATRRSRRDVSSSRCSPREISKPPTSEAPATRTSSSSSTARRARRRSFLVPCARCGARVSSWWRPKRSRTVR